MEARASRQALATAHPNYAGDKVFYKMKVTGPRTAEFIGTPPLHAMDDIQHGGRRRMRSHPVRPVRAGSSKNNGLHCDTKAVGSQCAKSITEPLRAMRELNPSLNEMIRSTEQMNEVLCETAKQPLNKRRRIASSAVAMHDAHLQRLKAHMSDTAYGYNPMHALAQASPMVYTESTTQPSHVDKGESSLGSHASMQRVMSEIPKKFHNKVATLGNYLSAHPNLIRVTPGGHPIVAGKEIPNANIMDIMRSLYIWPKSHPLPSGLIDVIAALRSAGTPSYLLSNSTVRTMYARLPETAEQSPMELEEQESEAQREEEEEQESEEEEQHEEHEPEGQAEEQVAEEEEEQESAALFETPLHTALPPVVPIRKVETRIQAKPSPSMIPKPVHVAAKVSGIPTMRTKREAEKASTGQAGKGYKDIAEKWHGEPHFPGKPLRILRLYGASTTAMPTKRKPGKASSISETRQYGDGITEHIYDDPHIPGKKLRVLRLY